MYSRLSLQVRIRRLSFIFAGLFVASVFGYMLIEQFSLTDSIYMTVITLSTVGFAEVQPLSDIGRIFTIFVILIGVGTVAYTLGTIGEFVITGELENTLWQRRMNRSIEKISNHYIVCGYGRVGQQVIIELQQLKLPFVVIDKNPEIIETCRQQGFLGVEGDATEDEILSISGVNRAAGLLSVLSEDADNVFVVLSARTLNPDLTILARASSKEAEKKLIKAGSTQTFSPPVMAGFHMVSTLLRPNAMQFIEKAIGSLDSEMWVEEVRIEPGSELEGQNLGEGQLRMRTGANVLAIIGGRKHEMVDWSPDLQMEAGDILIVLGKPTQIRMLAKLARDQQYLKRSSLFGIDFGQDE